MQPKMSTGAVLLLGLLLLSQGFSDTSAEQWTLCSKISPQFQTPCLCTLTTIDCDHVVFAESFSPLATLPGTTEYMHRFAGLTIVDSRLLDMPENGTDDKGQLSVDLSHNLIRKLGDRAFDKVRDGLRGLNLSYNALGDQLNPIFSTSELANLPRLTILDLGHNEIRDMDDRIFLDLPSLEELHLEGNDLRKVPRESLAILPRLAVLTLGHNSIGSLKKGDFAGLSSIAEVDLGSNGIRRVDPGTFLQAGNISVLHLDFNLLQSLPAQAFQGLEQLRSLDLSSNFLDSVPSAAMSNLESLEKLSLASNRIKTITPRDFSSLGKLRSLDLTRNSITELPAGFLQPLRDLTHLILDVNRITRIDDMAFEGLEDLEELSMADNTILGIPTEALARVPRLHKLSLRYNRVAAIDETILENVRNVIHLDLAYNLIRDVPEATFSSFYNLTSLNLEGNHLMALDNNMLTGLGETLRHLDLSYNVFQAIPTLVFPRMLSLKLCRNGISVLSEGFQEDLPLLQKLDLAGNDITEFSLSANTQLKFLNLGDNNLTVLAATAFGNVPLKYLSIQGNHLKEIIAKTFTNLAELEELDLSGNHLNNIEANAFDNLPSLKTLNLSRNDIVVFRGESLNTTLSLEVLDLSNNHIHYLLPDSFKGCANIKYLDLSDNRLTVLVGEVLRGAPFLTTLDIHNNVLQSVEDSQFSHLTRLRNLNISSNRVSSIGSRVFKNTSQLQDIDMSGNQLTTLPEDSFHGLLDLRIDLSRNSIEELADNVFGKSHVARLRGVNLAFNLLTRLPLTSMDEQYGNLEYLNIADNRVVHVPKNGNILVNVKHVDLSGNPLSSDSLSAILNEPKTARSIHLSRCGIKELPDLETPFLRTLNISHNNITSLKSGTFNRATLLRVIDLSANLLTDLRSNNLFVDLQHFDVSGNKLTSVTSESFQHSPRLKTLRLHNLPELRRLEAEAFDGLSGLQSVTVYGYPKMSFYDYQSILGKLPALRSLEIEIKVKVLDHHLQAVFQPRLGHVAIYGTTITNLTTASFAGLSNPKLSIGIHGTNLQTIPPKLVNPLPMSSQVVLDVSNNRISSVSSQFVLVNLGARKRHVTLEGLEDNPLRCDCGVFQLKQWLVFNRGDNRVTGNLTCSEPQELRGKEIVSVPDKDLTCEKRSKTTEVPRTTVPTLMTDDDDVNNVEEPDIIFEAPSGSDGYPTTPQAEDSGTSASLTNMDSIIIGVIVGVVAFICILIIVVCIVKLKHGQRSVPQHPGPLLVQSIVPYRFHPQGHSPSCTCGKSTIGASPSGAMTLCRCLPNYPPHPPHPPKLALTEGSLPRSGYYPTNPPYYVTYPDSDNDYR